MKITWLSHFFPYPPAGGYLQRSYHLLRQTASRNDVRLISLRKDRDRPEPEDVEGSYAPPSSFCESVDVFPIPSEESPLRRLLVLASGFWDSDPYDDRWLESAELAHHLDRKLDSGSVDLLHLDTLGLAQYRSLVPGVPAILNHHNIESHMMARRSEQSGGFFRQRYMEAEADKLARWEKRWCGEVQENLVVSSLDGQRLTETVSDASWTVIPNGVDTDFFRPEQVDGADEVEEGLIFVGRMNAYTNRDAVEWFLEEVWPRLLTDDSDRTLTLVGSSPPTEKERFSGAPNVHATGFVPDIRPYMNRAAIYVCPIRTGGGTRLKILDAMAMSMPLVATGMSVEGLELDEGRHFLRAETPADFVEAIGELEDNDELRATLARNARREAVERFSWSSIGEKLDVAYQNAAAG